jgi:hypothetical protein
MTPEKETQKKQQSRGFKESGRAIELLRAKWPTAFAREASKVRPLCTSVAKTISAAMGWDHHYTRAVMSVWKSRSAYIDAVLDGKETTEAVDDRARLQAQQSRERSLARRKKARDAAARISAAPPLALGLTPQGVEGRGFGVVPLGLDLPARADAHASPHKRQEEQPTARAAETALAPECPR